MNNVLKHLFYHRNRKPISSSIATVLLVCVTLFPLNVAAYVGPGAGLSTIGTAIALLVSLILLIVGFVWYPVKRFLKKRDNSDD